MNDELSEVPVPPESAHAGPSNEEDDRVFIELPRPGRSLSAFAQELGAVMSRNGVFLQDGVPVVVEPHTDRMEDLDPDCFRSYPEKHVMFGKWRKKKKEKPTDPDEWEPCEESMNKMQASGVLRAHPFRAQQRPLAVISPIPLPVRIEGKLVLHCAGYEPKNQLLVRAK